MKPLSIKTINGGFMGDEKYFCIFGEEYSDLPRWIVAHSNNFL